jgi:hypothetical protein
MPTAALPAVLRFATLLCAGPEPLAAQQPEPVPAVRFAGLDQEAWAQRLTGEGGTARGASSASPRCSHADVAHRRGYLRADDGLAALRPEGTAAPRRATAA